MDDRTRLRELEDESSRLRHTIDRRERTCQHDWSKPERKVDRQPSYTIPGDPPGTMGVDRQLDVHVAAKTEVTYIRTCKKCGKTEKRSPAKKEVETNPFG